jgi:hypothetical protein
VELAEVAWPAVWVQQVQQLVVVAAAHGKPVLELVPVKDCLQALPGQQLNTAAAEMVTTQLEQQELQDLVLEVIALRR